MTFSVLSHAGKNPVLCFCITSLACNPFYLVQTLSLHLVSVPIQRSVLKIIILNLYTDCKLLLTFPL